MPHVFVQKRQDSDLDVLSQLQRQLVELLVRLGPLVVVGRSLGTALGRHHNHASRPLCAAGSAQLGSARQVDVRNVVVLAENRDVRDDVDGGDVGGQDDNAGWEGVGDGWVAGGGLADCFYDFLDTALEALLLGRWVWCQ